MTAIIERIKTDSIKRKALTEDRTELVTKLTANKEEATHIIEAQVFIQAVAKATQDLVKIRIEDLVGSTINTIFPDRYEFEILFETRRNKTETDIVLKRNGRKIDPLKRTGGGVSDIISFAIRVIALMMSGRRKTLILDQPFKNVSEDLLPITYEVVKELCNDLGIQIIAVSHDPNMIEIADKVIRVKLEKKPDWDRSKVI